MDKAQQGDIIEIVEPKHSWGLYQKGDVFIVSERWPNDLGVIVGRPLTYSLQIYDHEYKIIKKGQPIMEQKVYNGWAFTKDEDDKGRINREIYKELMEKHSIVRVNRVSDLNEAEQEAADVIIQRTAGYNHATYYVAKNTPELSHDEILLICDQGNLCFGGSFEGGKSYRVSED